MVDGYQVSTYQNQTRKQVVYYDHFHIVVTMADHLLTRVVLILGLIFGFNLEYA
jgi:hypothetical protein